MASHAHDLGDTFSAAKTGGIAVALITAGGGIIVAVVNLFGPADTPVKEATTSQAPTVTTITPTSLSQKSDRGTYDKLAYGDSGVTVYGHADSDVDGVFVLVGPKPSGGYWVGFANVFDQRWQANVATQSKLQPDQYPVTTFYHRSANGAAQPSAFKLTFQGTTPTTAPPSPTNQIVNCAEQLGPSCFNGPGWGPPSVYQPNQPNQ